MNIRIFIGLIVALGVLFALGVGAGLRGGADQDASLDGADWAAWIEEKLPSSTVTSDDIDRASPLDCLDVQRDELLLSANDGCALEIAPAKRQRSLVLDLVAGDSAEITLIQPIKKNGDTLTSRVVVVRGGDSAEIDIFRQQNDRDDINVTIRCRATTGEQCRLQFP